MIDTIILQRVLPHYRTPLFQALFDRFGWHTVVASNPAGNTFLDLRQETSDHIHRFSYEFPVADRPYKCRIPIEAIVEELKPRRIISEFSMHMNAWHALPRLRAAGKIKSYALWSHGWNMERGFDSPGDVVMQYARLPPLALADLLLTYTNEGQQWLDRWLPWKKTIAISNQLDTDAIRLETRGVEGKRSGRPQFLAVGRLTRDKNMHLLLDAFAQVQRELPDAALTIVGDGPERGRLESSLLEKGLRGVTMAGALYQEVELARHFKGADLFLMPGAAGLSVNHALAYHLPIVAFGRGKGLPLHHPEIEYVVPSETGVLCHTPGERAFADAILNAWRNGEIARLKETIPAYVDRNLRLERMMESFSVVNSLL